MTYQYIDVPANRTTVISSIVDFAVANAGFTLVDGDDDFQVISKSGLYLCFTLESFYSSSYYEIAARLTTVEPTESNYKTVDGQYKLSGMGMDVYQGPYVGLHLFTNGSEVNCALEIVAGAFSHLSFGSILKFGTYTGGQYLTGSVYSVDAGYYYPTSLAVNPFDGGLNTGSYGGWPSYFFCNSFYYDSQFYAESYKVDNKRSFWGGVSSTCNTSLFNVNYAAYNYRRPLLPLYKIIETTTSRNKVVGVSEQAKYINMLGLLNKEIIEYDWMVFPYSQRSLLIGSYFDTVYANTGLAYKK